MQLTLSFNSEEKIKSLFSIFLIEIDLSHRGRHYSIRFKQTILILPSVNVYQQMNHIAFEYRNKQNLLLILDINVNLFKPEQM